MILLSRRLLSNYELFWKIVGIDEQKGMIVNVLDKFRTIE